jgi:hypothetical protein
MKDFFKDINGRRVLQVALLGSAVFLAYNNVSGWGWLLFILFCTL